MSRWGIGGENRRWEAERTGNGIRKRFFKFKQMLKKKKIHAHPFSIQGQFQFICSKESVNIAHLSLADKILSTWFFCCCLLFCILCPCSLCLYKSSITHILVVYWEDVEISAFKQTFSLLSNVLQLDFKLHDSKHAFVKVTPSCPLRAFSGLHGLSLLPFFH